VSYDLYFWKSGITDDPDQLADQLADEEADSVPADAAVLAFRAEALRRWPELADMIEPWHKDLGWREPGDLRTDLADRYVILTLPYSWSNVAELPLLARRHGLDCYDPQADELV
jgi:hypothetical protein